MPVGRLALSSIVVTPGVRPRGRTLTDAKSWICVRRGTFRICLPSSHGERDGPVRGAVAVVLASVSRAHHGSDGP